MERISRWARLLLTFTLIATWSMPRVVATEMWKWMTDYQSGRPQLHPGQLGFPLLRPLQLAGRDPATSGLVLIGIVVVWGALPFVVITVYAGLTQVPKELVRRRSSTVPGRPRCSGW